MSNEHSADVRVAIAQAAPRLLDVGANVERAVGLIGEAAAKGALLVAFGEAWLTGYPVHAWGSQKSAAWWAFATRYLESAVEVPGPETDALCEAARDGHIDVVIGLSEREPSTQGTLYSTILVIDGDGRIVGRHRKLRPSPHERAVWADGDGASLKTLSRDFGMLSVLAGAEHQMALPTYELARQGTQFHVACWPGGETPAPSAPVAAWPHQHLLSRAFAAQTGAFVLCAAGTLDIGSVPEAHRGLVAETYTGDSVIIDPRGEIIAGPAEGETLLVADCPLGHISAAKLVFDCSGHSARPDRLDLAGGAGSAEPFEDDGTDGEPYYGDDQGFGDDAAPPPSDDGAGAETDGSGSTGSAQPKPPARTFSRRDLFRKR